MKEKSLVTVCYAALAILVLLIAGTFWKSTSGRPYLYDEADYMYAGTRGFAANFLDRPSLSTTEFVRQGLELAGDRSEGSSMSKFIRTAGDITFYRHYHGPMYAYWIALCNTLGLTREAQFRASGLLIHAAVTLIIFICFRMAFPEYSAAAALAAALTFLFDRTALVAATSITQHVMFGLTAALTLFPLALFCRTGERKYWYLASAALGVAFATVETSFVLVGAVLLVLPFTELRRGWKPALRLLGAGTLIFLLAMLVVWPKGVLKLNVLKGYIYLTYIAIVKKTFTPMSPFALWGFKFREYPEEYIVPFAALTAATIFWRRIQARRALIPFLIYSWLFTGVTMIITAPYTYYHASLFVSISVVVGAVFGEFWRRGTAFRTGMAAVLLVSLVWMDVRFHGDAAENALAPDHRRELIEYLNAEGRRGPIYIPAVLGPMVHFYAPEFSQTTYDESWTAQALESAIEGAGEAELICERNLCDAVQRKAGGRISSAPVMHAETSIQLDALYSLRKDLQTSARLPNQ